jgi:hypothetical protein
VQGFEISRPRGKLISIGGTFRPVHSEAEAYVAAHDHGPSIQWREIPGNGRLANSETVRRSDDLWSPLGRQSLRRQPESTDPRLLRPLPAPRPRAPRSLARDEGAASHSITSSARASSVGGTSSPLLGGAAAWPLASRAEAPTTPVIGYLGDVSPEARRDRLGAFRKAWRIPAMSRGVTSRSSIAGPRDNMTVIAGPRDNMTVFLRSPPTSFAAAWP